MPCSGVVTLVIFLRVRRRGVPVLTRAGRADGSATEGRGELPRRDPPVAGTDTAVKDPTAAWGVL